MLVLEIKSIMNNKIIKDFSPALCAIGLLNEVEQENNLKRKNAWRKALQFLERVSLIVFLLFLDDKNAPTYSPSLSLLSFLRLTTVGKETMSVHVVVQKSLSFEKEIKVIPT